MKLRHALLVLLAVAGTFVLAQGSQDVITVALSSAPETLDPHVASSRAVPLLQNNIYEPLAGLLGPTTKISPILATSWDVSEDGTVYTFHLRPNVTFHDGTPFDANAVKVNFERVQTIKKGPYWALDYLQSIKVVDPLTVQMTIKPGGPPFIQAVSMVGIISPKALADHAVDGDHAQGWLALHTDGTGPYMMTNYVRGDRVILEAYDKYWGGWSGKHFKRAVMLIVPEESSEELMLEQGKVDIAEQVPTSSLDRLSKDPNITVYESDDGVRVLYLMLNYAAGPTADRRVRLALNYAFDTKSFLAATGGAFVPSDGPVPASLLGGYKPDIPYATYDLAKAKQLLQEAGALNQTINIFYTTGDQPEALAGQVLQAGLQQIGVKSNVIAEDFPALLRGVAAWGNSDRKASDPNYHMTNLLYTPPRMPDAYAYLWYMYDSEAQGGRGRNLNFYQNPEVDKLISEGALASDPQKRLDFYKQAVDQIVQDVPQVFIGTARKIYTVRKSVGGFYMDPIWYPAERLYPLYRQ